MDRIHLFVIFCLITSCSAPKALFTIEKDSQFPQKISLTNLSKNGVTYEWDFDDDNKSEEFSQTHTYLGSGKYDISLTAINGNKKKVHKKTIYIDAPTTCQVWIKTTLGDMVFELYNQTPLHRDNFIKMVENGYYKNLIFHRVIEGFMAQGGDPYSRNAPQGQRLGGGGPGYTIPAEFIDTLVHLKGCLAAARTGDETNPSKESSGSQFFIVQGRTIQENQLNDYELQKGILYTPYAKYVYKTMGGTPQLDAEYTVFGRIISGLEVLNKICLSKVDGADRPLDDVRILEMVQIR